VDERRAAGRGRHDRLRHGDRQVGREVRHPPLHVKIDGELLPGTENDLKLYCSGQEKDWISDRPKFGSVPAEILT